MKRKTRVQIAILRENDVLLLYHVMPQHNAKFWGLPGGGVEENETPEQAAVREAKEETCLDIVLGDFKFEYDTENRVFYDQVITFIGYPVGGEAKVGFDPEEGMAAIVQLTDIKWHPLEEDTGLTETTRRDVQKIRDFVNQQKEESIQLQRNRGENCKCSNTSSCGS